MGINKPLPKGFHEDKYLLNVADFILKRVNYFIETGTNIGITLHYVARTYGKINCIACEPDKQAFLAARKRTIPFKRVRIFNETSQKFINRLYRGNKRVFKEPIMFWLDAHGHGFEWPLKNEIKFITTNFATGFILIDDFMVPHNKKFKFNSYKKRRCSFAYIKDSIDKKCKFSLYYPNYTEHTSPFHPLVGWGLLQFGRLDRLEEKLPHELRRKDKTELRI